MRYRKLPVTIDAIVWDGTNFEEVLQFCTENDNTLAHYDIKKQASGTHALSIFTCEGAMMASIGDYIIKGIDGEFYPCKPHIFKKTYAEAV